MFYCMFYFTCDRSLSCLISREEREAKAKDGKTWRKVRFKPRMENTMRQVNSRARRWDWTKNSSVEHMEHNEAHRHVDPKPPKIRHIRRNCTRCRISTEKSSAIAEYQPNFDEELPAAKSPAKIRLNS